MSAWPIVQLRDVCDIRIGRTPSRANPAYWGPGHSWATIADLVRDPLTSTTETITDRAVEECRLSAVPSGTLLYSFKLTIGRMAVPGVPIFTNEAIAALHVRDPHRLDRDFLRFALASGDTTELTDNAVKGRTLNSASLGGLVVPLPPLDQQRRIAARLAGAIGEARMARDAVEARSGELDGLRQSAINAAFRAASRAVATSLGSIGRLVDGDWILTADYAPSGVRLLQVGDVGRGRLNIKSNRHVTEQRAVELKCTLLEPGDVLISRMPKPLGRACLLPDLGYPCITAVDVTIMRADPTKVATDYLVEYLNSDDWYAAADAKSSGATRARISRKNLELLPVPLPSVPKQRRIAARLREQLAEIDRAKTALEMQRKAIDALPAALLREVFGEVIAA